MRKRRDSELMSTDEDSDTDDDVDDESDDIVAATADEDSLQPTSSKQRNGVCSENNGPVDGLPNDIKGPRFR